MTTMTITINVKYSDMNVQAICRMLYQLNNSSPVPGTYTSVYECDYLNN